MKQFNISIEKKIFFLCKYLQFYLKLELKSFPLKLIAFNFFGGFLLTYYIVSLYTKTLNCIHFLFLTIIIKIPYSMNINRKKSFYVSIIYFTQNMFLKFLYIVKIYY